jgi:hypothetical protein
MIWGIRVRVGGASEGNCKIIETVDHVLEIFSELSPAKSHDGKLNDRILLFNHNVSRSLDNLDIALATMLCVKRSSMSYIEA